MTTARLNRTAVSDVEWRRPRVRRPWRVMHTVLLVVPMYHANAWGVVYSAPAVGAKLVLPGQRMDGESIYNLIEDEGVTYSAAVPTVWQMLLQYMQENGKRFTTLERVTIGGSACPESIIRTFRDDYGVDVIQGWGMTETSPLGTVSVPNASVAAKGDDAQMAYKLKQGRLLCGLEMKLVDDAGHRLPHDGKTPGRLMIKGPTIARGYFGGEGGDVLDDDLMSSIGQAALGVVSSHHYSAAHDSPENKAFVAAADKAIGNPAELTFPAVGAYDGMHVIYKMIEATGGKQDAAKAVEAVKGLAWSSPRGPVSIDPESRHITQNIYLREVAKDADGKFINKEIQTFEKQGDPGLAAVK